MLVSYNWLKNYVNLEAVTPEELAAKITKSGIEVEGIEHIAGKNENIVVGYVESCEKHPDADKLNLTQVNIGEETLQIVCGAPNVARGQKVAVAKPGAVLPGNMKIKKVKLRGVESNGMICSLQELGLEEKYIPTDIAEGIFVFPEEEDIEVGSNVDQWLNLTDAVLDLDVLANRPDALSMLGVAYEVAAVLNQPIELPSGKIDYVGEKVSDQIDVNIEAKDLNPYYGAFIVKDVKIKPSPLWMRNYLMASGIRPINNVVDITNYVLLEYGQPLHAFDFDRFGSNKIVIRRGNDGEVIQTLDEQERKLTKDNLVITNGSEPVALAGVMGGANSEVTDKTVNVLLEAAYFEATSVRHTVRQTGLRSESSTRFEKGIDPNRIVEAGLRACQLMQRYAGGKVLQGYAEENHLDVKATTDVKVPLDQVNQRLGMELSEKDVQSVLNRLKFNFDQDGHTFIVHVPTRRSDIKIFEDMLEEIIRIHGYDYLPYTIPQGWVKSGGLTENQLLQRKVREFMMSSGAMETLTYSLTNEKNAKRLVTPNIDIDNSYPISLAMPMSEDHKYLRLSIVPELLRTLQHNVARKQTDLNYFEIGKVFISEEQELTHQPTEKLHLAGAYTGLWHNHPWQQEKKPVDFFVVKGIIESLSSYLQINISFKQIQMKDMHPGRCAELNIDGEKIGYMGQLHPKTANLFDLPETYVFEIDLDTVFEKYNNVPSFTDIPRYPSVSRDIAFILDTEVFAGEVQQYIQEIGAPLVKEVFIFDVYQGEHLEEGKKSVAYRLIYQDPAKTLQDDEVDSSYQQIVESVNKKFGSYVRS
ncbi:phenylalanine--tRNA ligase subunit beta [Oceanobacillus sp. E9]|uniref:phenylalanine--tRNA ligase subunit beta n=1 Tax=Oceanobacillus sp. E9 TaxID=1742575 RepID=UPI00084E549F|nr:phenylalanine--tRNA ligase subunit beta [Oceanobacillus sp. E9]OEH55439.1 phenylalanine--tRNA ligase subunit beta [Oceanobacillus sp. E9]